jgi:hypothetical protein
VATAVDLAIIQLDLQTTVSDVDRHSSMTDDIALPKVDRVLREAQSFKSELVPKRRKSLLGSSRQFYELSYEPSPNIELHQAFVSHFQKEGQTLCGFSPSALRIFSRSFSTIRLLPSSSAPSH